MCKHSVPLKVNLELNMLFEIKRKISKIYVSRNFPSKYMMEARKPRGILLLPGSCGIFAETRQIRKLQNVFTFNLEN